MLDRSKILIPLLLPGPDMNSGAQNIDSPRLAGKILRDKGLGMRIPQTPPGSGNAADSLGSVLTISIVSLPHLRSRLFVTRLEYFSVEGCGKENALLKVVS